MNQSLVIALDFSSKQEVEQFLQPFEGESLFLKVGMELFYKEGPAILAYLNEHNHRIFLDLKLHDIPNTVKQGMKSLANYGVDMVNVHAAGGTRMMEAAVEGLIAGTQAGKQRPLCIAVTQLTSTSQGMMERELLIKESLNDVVLHYAKQADESGLDGVVCSSLEVPLLCAHLRPSFLTVTPGIRMADDSVDDQVRIVTPQQARENGSSAIVVGRSITKAKNPVLAYQKMKQQWEGVTV
ncbi:orotidine-5'-phosphate decarboxylase [Priestia koreensis]|uniref:orotidine-5'-phosphate decarboxylase n=1 Tax=Priestia koreensis TaxID=284581 RepID=UPI0030172392